MAEYRHVEVARLMVMGDDLFHAWRPVLPMDELDAGLSEAAEIALEVVARLE